MLLQTPLLPDNSTFPFAIKAAPRLGAALHTMVLKSPLHSHDIFILNSLVHFYASCGNLNLSFQLFDKIPHSHRDVVSWNSIIAAFAQAGPWDKALDLFRQMEDAGIRPNDVTMIIVLSACGMKVDLEFGRQIHSYIDQNDGIAECLILNNAILDMYVKCGGLEDAKLLFDRMMDRDSISWTTMLVGYAKSREFDAARRLFDEMPSHDIASWNALISGYEQNGKPKDALALFSKLQYADAEPDQVTLVAALSACSQLGAMETGCCDP